MDRRVDATKYIISLLCYATHLIINYKICSLSEPTYTVITQTADESYAGTSGEVSIDLIGSEGSAEDLKLDNLETNFKRGA